MRKIALFTVLILAVLTSCATREVATEYVYVPVELDLPQLFKPLFDSRPKPPEFIEDVQTLSDVLYNSAQFQLGYYQMSDYADSLERAILNGSS